MNIITLYKNKQQTVDINGNDLPVDIPDDVLGGFIHNFNHGFDEYSFNEILHEIYQNHDDDTPQKKSNNGQNLTTSIKGMIKDLTNMNQNIQEYMPNYDLGTFIDNVEQLNYTHSALIYIHMKSQNKEYYLYYIKLEKCA